MESDRGFLQMQKKGTVSAAPTHTTKREKTHKKERNLYTHTHTHIQANTNFLGGTILTDRTLVKVSSQVSRNVQ